MNRIEKLIGEMCPEGVDTVELGKVCNFERGTSLEKKELRDEGFPVVHYGEIHTKYGYKTYESISFVDDEKASKMRKASSGDLILVTTSEDVESVATPLVWLGDGDLCVGGETYIIKSELDSLYLAHYFMSSKFKNDCERYISGTKVKRVSSRSLSKISIPSPPLEIQKEIVNILDKFTQLEAELEAELEAREKQYEEVRKRLLDFESDTSNHPLGEMIREMCPEGVESSPMHGCCEYVPDKVKVSESESLAYTGVDNLLSNKGGRSESRYPPKSGSFSNYREGDVLLGNIRPYLRKIWMADESGICGGDVLAIRAKQEWRNRIQPRFLFHVLSSEEFFLFNMKNSRGTKMPRGDKKAIMKFQIPVPPLEIQKEIVRILDNLDSLVNSVNEGIPAEIAARRKQYEYYRDKLLTFKELDAA